MTAPRPTPGTATRSGALLLAFVAVFAVVVALAGVAGVAADGTATGATANHTVSSCTTLDTSGTYEITQSFNTSTNDASDACIEIVADDVTLDGNHHAINDSYDAGIAVRATDVSNVTVTNLTAREPTSAVVFDNVTDSRIEDVSTATLDTGDGVASESSGIVLTDGSNDNVVRDTDVTSAGDGTGAKSAAIEIDNSHNNRIENNDVDDPYWYGVWLVGADNNNLTGNDIQGDTIGTDSRNMRDAVRIGTNDGASSDDNVVHDNDLDGQADFPIETGEVFGLTGVNIRNGDGAEIVENTIVNFEQYGVFAGYGNGDQPNTLLVDNVIDTVGDNGVLVSSPNANVTDNTVTWSGQGDQTSTLEGVRVTGDDAEIVGNEIASGGGDGLFVGNVTGLTARDNHVHDNDGWAVNVTNSTATIESFDVDSGAEAVTASGTNFSVNGTVESEPVTPSGEQGIGVHVNASGSLTLEVEYADADVSSLDESSLSMWHYNDSWTEVTGTNSVDAENNTVVADANASGTLAPLADNEPPDANVTAAPTDAEVGESVAFNASTSSDPDGTIAEYRWDFDGDGTVDETTSTAETTNSYASTGTYEANVTVVDDGGDTDVASVTITVTAATGPVGETWPRTGFDRENTVYAADNTGPVDDASEAWNSTIDQPVVVGDDAVYGSRGGDVQALYANNGTEKWSDPLGDDVQALALESNTLYAASEDSIVAYHASSGDVKWVPHENSDGIYRTTGATRLAVDDDRVYAALDDTTGGMVAFDANNRTRVDSFGRYGSSDDTFTRMAVRNDSLYVGTKNDSRATGETGSVTALDTGDGSERWRFATGNESFTAPAVWNGTVYAGLSDDDGTNTVYAVDADTGSEAWNETLDSSFVEQPSVGNGTVYVATDGNVSALDASDGSGEWTRDVGPPATVPAVANETVYVADEGGDLHVLDANDGETRLTESVSTFRSVSGDLAVVDRTVYVAGVESIGGNSFDQVYAMTGESASEPAAFAVGVDATNAPVTAGENLTVDATVENSGELEGTQVVNLSVDGVERDATSVTLASGESSEVTLSWDTGSGDAGNYTVEVASTDAAATDSVEVQPATGTVSGTVTDDNDSAVGNATVTVQDLDDPAVVPGNTTTASDGSYSVEVPVGDYDVRVEASDYAPETRGVTVDENTTSTVDVQLSPVDDGENDTADNPTVVATSVTHVGGTQPDLSNVSLATSVFEGIQLTLLNDTADSDAPPWAPSRFELSGHGADATTELELEVQVENFEPRLLAGAGNVTDWQVTENGDGTSNVTVQVRPVTVQRIVDCDQYGDACTPSMESWPTGDDDQATVSMDAAASLGLYNGSGQPSGTAGTLNGTVFTSNAQFQNPPEYVPGTAEQPPRLVLSVAGPHYATDGDVTDGTVTAFLPGDLLNEWNVTDPDQLTVTYRGNETSFDAESAGDGLWLTADLTYSAGDVVISPSGDDGGETDESAPVVESLTVDGTDVTGDAPVYVNESTASVAATYSDTGTGVDGDAVELTVGSSTKTLDSVDSSGLDTHVTLSDGTRAIELLVVDNAGNERRVDGTVVVDTAAPAVDLTVSRTDHVSENQPVEIEAESSDENAGETTVVVENASTGTEVANWTVTGDVADGTVIRTWNATDVDGTPVPSGAYDVTVASVDAAGNANSTTTPVTVDTTDPTATVTAVGVNESAASPPSGQTVHTNGTVSFEVSADGTPGDAESVSVVLESASSNFDEDVELAREDGEWVATTELDEDAVPDDGRYDVVVAATDPAGNENETTADATVRLDREAPDLAATVTQFDADEGRVNVTTPDALDGDPTIEVEKPGGSNETATIEDSGTGYWNASFNLTEDGGQYNVTVTGTDRAGNRGTDTASTVVDSVETENNSATVVLEPSGLFVNFTTDQVVTDTVVMTESETPLAPLTAGNAGVNFLDAQLGDHIAGNLSHAVIGIPVDMDAVPGSVEKDDVEIRYYNETADAWEEEDTTVEERTVLGESREYWVANVTHFSTYGAVASDDTAPTVDHASPSGELAAGDTNATVRFEYSDDVSGVNASEVSLSFDDSDVTGEDAATVTSEYATYDAPGLSPGSYDATVTVVDEAGNERTGDTTFTVSAADDGEGDDGDESDGDGSEDDSEDGDTDGEAGDTPTDQGTPGVGDASGTPDASVTPLDDGGVAVEIRDVAANQTAAVEFEPVETGEASLDELALEFGSARDAVDVEVRPSAVDPDGVPALDAADAVGYVEVEHDAPDAAVEGATFRFEVPSSALPEGASLDDVTLYRYHDGDWNALDTTRDGTEFEAESPGLSAFAIGVDRPTASLGVTGVNLSATSVEPGESVTVTATVANDGDASGDTELAVSVDGETVETETVSVDASESTQVSVTHAFEDAGSYEIAVDGDVAGTVVVEQATTAMEPTATDEPADESTTTESGDTGGGVSGFGAMLAVVAFLAAALVAVRRRR